MKTFSSKAEIKRGWELWKANKAFLSLAALFILAVGSIPNDASDWMVLALFEIALFLLTTLIWIGWTKILLFSERGEKPVFGDFFRHTEYFWNYLWASLLLTLIVGIGLILLVVPGVYLALKYQFALTLIVDRNLGIREAFAESAKITDGVKWKLLGFAVLATLICILGVIVLGVGLLVAVPVVGLAYISIYRKLLAEAPLVPNPTS